jgi:hypothetical protein
LTTKKQKNIENKSGSKKDGRKEVRESELDK